MWTLYLCMFEGRKQKLARHKTRAKPSRWLPPEKRSLANKRTHVRPMSILRGVFEPRLQLIARPIPCNRGRRRTCVRHASASLEQCDIFQVKSQESGDRGEVRKELSCCHEFLPAHVFFRALHACHMHDVIRECRQMQGGGRLNLNNCCAHDTRSFSTENGSIRTVSTRVVKMYPARRPLCPVHDARGRGACCSLNLASPTATDRQISGGIFQNRRCLAGETKTSLPASM